MTTTENYQKDIEFMHSVFSNKESEYLGIKLWNGEYFNWTGFNCVMFNYWDCDEFNDIQRMMINSFHNSVKKSDKTYYKDFVGDSLHNICETIESLKKL